MGLIHAVGPGPVALDTCVFIYFIERDPTYLPVITPLFAAIDRGELAGVTSHLTVMETLVVPYREGDHALARRYEALLTRSRGLSSVPLDLPLLRAAAHIRATARVKTPDAIQLAAALGARCSAFVTNDRAIPSVAGLRVVQLHEHVNAR